MTYLNLSRKNSSSNERCVSMNGTQLPEGLWLTCRRQPMSLSDSILYLGQKLDTVDHSLRGVTDVQWPTFDVMNCIIYLHAIPQVLSLKGSEAVGSLSAQRAFLNLLRLTASSQCLPVVITWQHLKCSTAVFVCAGVWRLQHWFCLHRVIAFFFFFSSHEVCT